MDDKTNPQIKAIYYELQGYLSQTPKPEQSSDIFASDDPWCQYNQAVDELAKISGEDFKRFIIKPQTEDGYNIVHLTTYRQTLGGLINRIHGVYFSNENMPFSGSPQTVISQTQNQTQSIQMILDVQSKIDGEIVKFKDDPKKVSFLKKVKSNLSIVKDVNDLLKLMLNTAKESGVNISDLLSFFG